jgi:hypothetical protein
MGGDKGHMEAAYEKAGVEEPVALVTARRLQNLDKRFLGGTGRG